MGWRIEIRYKGNSVKLDERLKQIEKRIAELQRKADAIKLELNPVPRIKEVVPAPEGYVEESHLFEAPRRRGRRKLNETE